MTQSELNKVRTIASLVVIIFLTLTGYVAFFANDRSAEIYFFDIGQGDSSLIVLPNDIQILIDGGPNMAILEKVSKAIPVYDRTIEYIILSHPHSDHLSGIVEVLKRYDVGLLIHNGVTRDNLNLYNDFEEIINKKNIKTHIVKEKMEIKFNETSYMEFYYPDASKEFGRGDINASSIVNRLTFGGVRVLFTGDIPRDVERYLIEKGEGIEADILKVAHQGSRTSSEEDFIIGVSPIFSVIMVGADNQYGHPHQKVLKTLERFGGEVLRTDIEGDILFKTDGDIIIRE
jgi:competence protein ComEC